MTTPTPEADPVVVPPPPVPPSVITPQGVIAYVGALAVFVLGILTATGVTVPHGIANDVNLIVGAAVAVSGALVPFVIHLFHLTNTKAAVVAGVPVEVARKL